MRFLPIAGLALILPAVTMAVLPTARAQSLSDAAVSRWVDDALSEIQRAGATEATRGKLAFDPATGDLLVPDIKLTFGAVKNDAVTVTIERIEGAGLAGDGERFKARKLSLVGLVAKAGEATFGMERIEVDTLDIKAFVIGGIIGADGSALAGYVREANAGTISIPNATMSITAAPAPAQVIVTSITYDGLVKGVVKRARLQAIDAASSEKANPLIAHFGPGETQDFDLAAYAALVVPSPALGNPVVTLSTKTVFEGGRIEVGKVAEMTIGRMTLGASAMRLPKYGMLSLFKAAFAMEASKKDGKADPALMRDYVVKFSDWLDLGKTDSMDFAGLEFKSPQGAFSLGQIEARDIASSRYGLVAIENVSLNTPDATIKLGRAAIRDAEFGAFLRAVLSELAAGRAQPNPAALEGKLPRIGAIELKAVELTAKPEIAMSLSQAEFAMGEWRGFVPDLLRLSVASFNLPSEAMKGATPPTPRDLGYAALNMGADLALKLDEAKKTLILLPGRFSIADLGAVNLEIALSNLDSGQFGFAGLTSPIRLMSEGRIDSVRVRLENNGLLERVLDWQARQAGRGADEMKSEMLKKLLIAVVAFTKDADLRMKAIAALEAFGKNSRSITVLLQPKGSPLTFLELAALSRTPPEQILARLDVTITTND